jgi:hypothetical protein
VRYSLTVGLIAAAGACMALIAKLGSTLLLVGLLITLAGVGWMLAVVTASGTTAGECAIIGPVFVIATGMGTCFGIIFDIALSSRPASDRPRSPRCTSPVSPPAAAQHAMILSLWVIGIVMLCTTIVPLLPKKGRGGRALLILLPATAPLGRTIRRPPQALPRGH